MFTLANFTKSRCPLPWKGPPKLRPWGVRCPHTSASVLVTTGMQAGVRRGLEGLVFWVLVMFYFLTCMGRWIPGGFIL